MDLSNNMMEKKIFFFIKSEFEELREGMTVEYMVVDCFKGKKAIGVVVT